jgi:hypothetical protein
MKIIIAVFFVFGFLACDVEARDKWTKEDTVRQLIFTGLMATDWRQTRYIANDRQYSERNPTLGAKPTTRKVDAYFAASTVLHAVAGYYLPARLRSLWQYSGIVVEYSCVLNNFAIGVRVDFN